MMKGFSLARSRFLVQFNFDGIKYSNLGGTTTTTSTATPIEDRQHQVEVGVRESESESTFGESKRKIIKIRFGCIQFHFSVAAATRECASFCWLQVVGIDR